MQDELKKNRENFVSQFQSVAKNIGELQTKLQEENKHLEQLRGAIVALDQLAQSLAPAAEAAAPETTS